MKKSISFPVVSFRNVETPFTKKGLKDYYCVVNTKDLPDLSSWRQINVRDPKLTGAVPRAIREGMNNPDLFLFMNRGLVLAVDSIRYDNQTGKATISLSDPKLHGLLDGGHSYNIIVEETPNLQFDQFVKIEILEGFESDDIAHVVDARNTSNQVRDESLMNLSGDFEPLKKALSSTSYFHKIAFKEFEIDDVTGDPKPIDVREIIAILTAFDADHFNDKVHPINTYRSKAACLKHFKEHIKSYKKIYPLAKEILALHDHIQAELPGLYNEVRGQNGDVSGGKFGKLTGVGVYDGNRHSELHFINAKSKYAVPAGFVYPILGAFRALLEEKDGRYYWGKELNPLKLIKGELGKKLADTIGNFALEAQNPSKTGKSPLVWQACYQSAELMYLKHKK